MKYKLICMDMDGTLLTDNKEVSLKNKEAIKAASDNGVKIAVTTGRLFTSAYYYADLIGVKAPVVSSNGAYIREKDENRIIYKSTLGIEKCRKILQIAKQYDLHPHFNTCEAVITDTIIYSSKAYIDANKKLPKEYQVKIDLVKSFEEAFKFYEDEILKCIISDNDADKLNKAKSVLADDKDFEVVSSYKNNFEVMNTGVSKGAAVKILAEKYGLKGEEVICMGDSENDLSMIKYAGLGIAMGNGEDYVKSAADYITDTNNNDGVAKAIERFVLV